MDQAHEENRVCECGKLKKPDYPQCYECSMEKARQEDRLCKCGKFKKPEFPSCYECSKKERAGTLTL